jgi:hypothetical protein
VSDADGVLSQSQTTTLSESIYNYRREHGRTYHGEPSLILSAHIALVLTLSPAYKDGKYIFPNDEVGCKRRNCEENALLTMNRGRRNAWTCSTTFC